MKSKVKSGYVKPKLERISLEKTESVLAGCKVSSSDTTASSKGCGHATCSKTLGS